MLTDHWETALQALPRVHIASRAASLSSSYLLKTFGYCMIC